MVSVLPVLSFQSYNNLVALNGRIYFTVWDTRYGTELWRHDPRKGTLAVANIVPERSSSRPQQLRAYDKWLVFCMDTTVDGSAVLRYADGLRNRSVVFQSVRWVGEETAESFVVGLLGSRISDR